MFYKIILELFTATLIYKINESRIHFFSLLQRIWVWNFNFLDYYNLIIVHKKCIFCKENIKSRIIYENKRAFAIYDINPVTKYHCLIITKRHIESFFTIKKNEIIDIFKLAKKIKKKLEKYKDIKGFNIGSNYKKVAGQTIKHCHFHLIPRRNKDYDLRLKKKKNFFWIK